MYIFESSSKHQTKLNMTNPITINFQNCVRHLKQSGQCSSYKKVAEKLTMHPQCLSDILHNKREVTLKILNDAISTFNCNPLFLHHGTGNMFTTDEDESHSESSSAYGEITYVSVAAQAGYVDQFHNPVLENELPKFAIPDRQYSQGVHRCFDIEGDSMEPTLFEGDKVVCRVIDPSLWFNNIRPNFVYVFATTTGLVIKRVESVNREEKTITLASDNDFYKPFVLHVSQMQEVSTLISTINHFRPFQNQEKKEAAEEMKLLKETIAQQSQLIQQLNNKVSAPNETPVTATTGTTILSEAL